ncbi:TapB family protein [Parabacteroides chinchillae]|uniref:DUF3108 domain-containing protein n=1 Tax=Parabacteroides chinchillae TaxID=871327 RepID=A0A8G2BYU2_9BACT|nr:hypothetical protein [Parabacteroides chinchillae]SEG17878.1 hypothetical protein SAMN05444001_11850 [Parabacteroides chinchillae]
MRALFRFITAIILTTLLVPTTIYAQNPFFPNKEGIILTYANYDKKGKTTDYVRYTISKVNGTDAQNFEVTYDTEALDKKKEVLFKMPVEIQIKNGAVYFDPSSSAGKLMEGVTITGEGTVVPATLEEGMTLEDSNVTVKMGSLTVASSKITETKVVAKEDITTPAGTFECYKVQSKVSGKAMGFKSENTLCVWYARNIGTIRTETYDKKNKLISSGELILMEGN